MNRAELAVTSPDIEQCIRAARSGDGDAFGTLYDEFVDRIYRYVRVRTGNDHDAEELTEQVFVRSWKAIAKYEDRGRPFLAWLYAIAGNVVADHFRSHRVQAPLDMEAVDDAPDRDPVEMSERSSQRDEIQAAIRQLPEEQQKVVVMRFMNGMTPGEVAEVIGKREGTVRVIQHRALAALRTILGRVGVEA